MSRNGAHKIERNENVFIILVLQAGSFALVRNWWKQQNIMDFIQKKVASWFRELNKNSIILQQ